MKKISENVGKGQDENTAVGNAMRELGYSDSYSNTPNKLTKTKSWNVLMEQELPDSLLTAKHKELLESKQVAKFTFPTRMKNEEIESIVNEAGFKVIVIRPSPIGKMAFYSTANVNGVRFGLDMAFKLKNKYAPETMNLKFAGYNKEQLIDMLLGKLKKK